MVYSADHIKFIDESEVESTIPVQGRLCLNYLCNFRTENRRSAEGKAREFQIFIYKSVSTVAISKALRNVHRGSISSKNLRYRKAATPPPAECPVNITCLILPS